MSQLITENESIINSSTSFISQPLSSAELSQMSSQEEFEPTIFSPVIRGWVNEHFTTNFNGQRKIRVCLAEGCGKQYSAGSSTRIFKDHWNKEHSKFSGLRKMRFMFSNDLHTNRLVKLVLSRHLDYSLVDQPEFKSFAESLNPNRHIICRQTLADLINRNRTYLTDRITDKLANAASVALTFDIWSAHKGSRGFGCVTAHFISTLGRMENLVLHFKRMKFPHNAETIKKFIEKPILVHNLKGRIAAITTDNASNNIAAIRMIDTSMGLTSLNLGFVHYKCVAHILDLAMKNGIKALQDTIAPVREAVMAIRSGRKRKENFFNKQAELIQKQELDILKPLDLAEDVDHRWNSAFVLLERAYLLRDAVDYILKTTKGLESLKSIDWPLIQKVIEFLKLFNVATKLLCSAKDVTISMVSDLIPRLMEHCAKWEANENQWISAAASSLKAKLTDYELELYHPIVDIAYFLDPRFKTKNLSDNHRKIVMDRMRKLVDEMPMPVNDSNVSSENSILGWDSDTDEPIDELASYCSGQALKKKSDVLMWWKTNSELYPKLSSIARKILPIQGTSVASERVFSTAGDVDSKSRNRLSDESVENIVLFKSWLQFLHLE